MLIINPSELSQLPKTSGVYFFYNDPDALPLYIGKSINIQKRVKSHFQQAHNNPREQKLIYNTRYIAYIITAGEIGALLLEAKLIRENLPLYNQKLRRKKIIYSYKLAMNNDMLQPTLVKQSSNSVELSEKLYGLFRSRRAAEQLLFQFINSHQLCKKILGLEKTSKSCFAYQLKKCNGACINPQLLQVHNERLQVCLNQYQHRIWPFKGLIGIIEKNEFYSEIHLIKNWIYLGTSAYDNNITPTLMATTSTDFDIDTYRIICNALHNKKSTVIELDNF